MSNPRIARIRWEYKVAFDLIPEELDDFGSDGWELVSVVRGDLQTRHVFKRPLKKMDQWEV